MAKNSNGLLCKLGIVKSPGAAVPHRKNTKDCATVDMPVPAQVTLVMQQHIGAPCTPTVKLATKCLLVPLLVTALHLSPHLFIPVCQERLKKLIQF